jgi:hypothetical protein
MKRVLLYLVLLCGACEYETNNYYGLDGDGGAARNDTMNSSDLVFTITPVLHGNCGKELDLVLVSSLVKQGIVDVHLDEPGPITVQLGGGGAVGGPFMGVNADYDAYALLEWGVEGGSASAEVDWKQGQTVTVMASNLRVMACLQVMPGGAVPATPVTVRLSAFAAPGYMPHSPPQRTYHWRAPVAGLGVGSTHQKNQAYPPFARTAQVVVVPRTSQVELEYQNWLATDVLDLVAVSFPSEPYPIPSTAAKVIMTNVGLAPISYIGMVHDLEL